ncbi:mersacidin/lichenicidin family type 2 lantibiotic [Georgenia wangjunii]|uniref:mersacidin/lichenicidin family type 2 lantibiotic n=1 Tax=Georgenia wangjunii TaxID=3117730 RepID=UPI002F261137
MSTIDAWKNPLLRSGADVSHPSGSVDLTELSDLELSGAAGGVGTNVAGTFGCCWCMPWYSSWTKCGLVCSSKCKW